MKASVDCPLPSAPAGTSSGEISVARIARSTCAVSPLNSPERAAKRIRCWISVLETEPLGL